jgi:ABC-type lipoprotein release transport system permease subunit
MAVALACCMLIFLWIYEEWSYDRFHENRAHVYLTWADIRFGDGRKDVFTGSFYPMADLIRSECPQVAEAVRWDTHYHVRVQKGDRSFYDNAVGFADPGFFDLFSFRFIQGDQETALDQKFSAVITRKTALRYFGPEDPMGKTLTILDEYDVQVTGVIDDVPRNSTLQFDCVLPFSLVMGADRPVPSHWGGNPFQTFVALHPGIDTGMAAESITDRVISKRAPLPQGMRVSIELHPLEKLHLYDVKGGGLIRSIVLFSCIALFVLLIACMNFINLTTARASTRADEVGLRKVVGATRGELIRQFLGESLVLSILTLCIALVLVFLFLPQFGQLLGRQVPVSSMMHPVVMLGFLLIALTAGFFSGCYPAFLLSSFPPAVVMRKRFQARAGGDTLRRILVISQFTLSIFLVIATMAALKQLHFIRDRDLGYEKDNILWLQMSPSLAGQYASLKAELQNNSRVVNVTRSLQNPGYIGSTVSALDWDGKDPQESTMMYFEYVDFDYVETMGLKMADGRSFSSDRATDITSAYIVNEEAVRLMGMEDPVDSRLSVFRNEGSIIGVIRDFHFMPLHHAIAPIVIGMNPAASGNLYIRVRPGQKDVILEQVEAIIRKFSPHEQNPVRILSATLMQWQYSTEQQICRIAGYFTILALIISCLGMVGLAAFSVQRRTKEIGIRKVMGASSGTVVYLLIRDLSRWVLIANAIAWPAAYWVIRKMLSQYAYRAETGPGLYLFAGGMTFLVAMATVVVQTWRAARINPIDTIRYE